MISTFTNDRPGLAGLLIGFCLAAGFLQVVALDPADAVPQTPRLLAIAAPASLETSAVVAEDGPSTQRLQFTLSSLSSPTAPAESELPPPPAQTEPTSGLALGTAAASPEPPLDPPADVPFPTGTIAMPVTLEVKPAVAALAEQPADQAKPLHGGTGEPPPVRPGTKPKRLSSGAHVTATTSTFIKPCVWYIDTGDAFFRCD